MPPPRAPATYVPAPAPMFTWAGVYLGVNAGYGFGSVTPSGFSSFNANGFLAGAQVGANMQWNSFVFGIEGDGDYNGIKGNDTSFAPANAFSSTYLATIRPRVGWARDRILFYGTAGGAMFSAKEPGFSTSNVFGWTAGAGIEAAMTQNWTAKVEYLYVAGSFSNFLGSYKESENVIRAGVNYKFNLW